MLHVAGTGFALVSESNILILAACFSHSASGMAGIEAATSIGGSISTHDLQPLWCGATGIWTGSTVPVSLQQDEIGSVSGFPSDTLVHKLIGPDVEI